jgi:TonB-dependent SusC/RagA subfamily outer membrane receptor
MNPIKFLSTILLILFSSFIFGQTSLIGKITNNKGEPIVNAIIYLDTIQTNSTTNVIGFFEVKVPEGTKEITLYDPKYGYLTYKYNNEKRLSIIFNEPKTEEKDFQISEIKNESQNSLNVKDDKNISSYRNIYEYINGKVAGVTVSNSNEITIRGGSSWELSNEPLFVVDGVIVHSIDNISPLDVETITILKGVETSIYGSRGSNGVLEIITKQQ